MKNAVRQQRTARKLTQAELAEMVAASRQTINAIESNKYVPSVVLALKIATALLVQVEEIFFLEDGEMLPG